MAVPLVLAHFFAQVAPLGGANAPVVGAGHTHFAAQVCPLMPEVAGFAGGDGAFTNALRYRAGPVRGQGLCRQFGCEKQQGKQRY